MIIMIPIILGAAALVTTGVGVVTGVDGASKIQEAKKIGTAAQALYERKQKSVENTLRTTQKLAEEYGQTQIQVKIQTIGRFVTFIERIGQKASESNLEFLAGLEGVSPQKIQEYKTAAFEAQRFMPGGVAAVGAAYAAGQGTLTLIEPI